MKAYLQVAVSRLGVAGMVMVLLGGIGCGPSRRPIPAELVGVAQIPGMPEVRDWGDARSDIFQRSIVRAIRQVREQTPDEERNQPRRVYALALSGGGSYGAFGAGLLYGWSQRGDRPEFQLVTGISTGALIAPFAYLGAEYDEALKTFYTTISSEDVYRPQPLLDALLSEDALVDTAPLQQLIADAVDAEFLEKVANAHGEGRRLWVGTTNLDARRLVVWDMGAIAKRGGPEALHLFRNVLRASSAIPVAFPPVYFDVEANGVLYDEMHVDGAVTAEVFFYGSMIDFDEALREAESMRKPEVELYVIRNSQVSFPFQPVDRKLMSIATHAMSSLLASHGVGDLYRIYTYTQKDGIGFHYAAVPQEYESDAQETFDREEMNRLFEMAREKAQAGYSWKRQPPGLGD